MNLLPSDLKSLIYLYIPYPEVLQYYSGDNSTFWLDKAWVETNEDPGDLFFMVQYPNFNNIKRYIRVLAYPINCNSLRVAIYRGPYRSTRKVRY